MIPKNESDKNSEKKAKKIFEEYTKIIEMEPKSPALTVKPNVKESLTEGIVDFGKKVLKSLTMLGKSLARWAVGYDKKLAVLKKKAGM